MQQQVARRRRKDARPTGSRAMRSLSAHRRFRSPTRHGGPIRSRLHSTARAPQAAPVQQHITQETAPPAGATATLSASPCARTAMPSGDLPGHHTRRKTSPTPHHRPVHRVRNLEREDDLIQRHQVAQATNYSSTCKHSAGLRCVIGRNSV